MWTYIYLYLINGTAGMWHQFDASYRMHFKTSIKVNRTWCGSISMEYLSNKELGFTIRWGLSIEAPLSCKYSLSDSREGGCSSCLRFVHSVMMRLHSDVLGQRGNRRSESLVVHRRSDYLLQCWGMRARPGILFCQFVCANGNVRASGKLMDLIGEMPPLWRMLDQLPLSFSGADVFSYFFWLFSLAGPAVCS